MSNVRDAISSGDLADLVVSSSSSTTVYPSDDNVISVLQARFRADLPYTRIGASTLVVVNPLKVLANVNEASAQEYEERNYKDTNIPTADSPKALQPHLYDLATRVYLMLRRRQESQSIIFGGLTGSGKTESSRLVLNQILRLSARTKKEAKLAEQIKCAHQILEAFGNSKTLINPNASRFSRYTELSFDDNGRICSAKILAYGLDKSRLNRLTHEERSFHVFYQLLAGATPEERDALGIEDVSDYTLLASSGCYRLPAGPFSDDTIQMGELRDALKTIGFKPKNSLSIFQFLMAILIISNLQFADTDSRRGEEPAIVSNPMVLDHVSHLLGVQPEDLQHALTNRSNYVRKELYSVVLRSEQAAVQREAFVRDLYAMLFAYIVETCNHRICQEETKDTKQISIVDHPGYQTRAPQSTNSMLVTSPLISAHGRNSFSEFMFNFQDEIFHSYAMRNIFEDSVNYNSYVVSDGISLPAITTMDNSACVMLLRGAQLGPVPQRKPAGLLGILSKTSGSFKSGKTKDNTDDDVLLNEIVSKYRGDSSFVVNPSPAVVNEGKLFGINHHSGSCSYDISQFVEKDADLFDAGFVSLLRGSGDPFVRKLFGGPSLSVELHHQDQHVVVQAQVSSRPLRYPTWSAQQAEDSVPLDLTKIYPVTTQINNVVSEILFTIDRTKIWNVSCIRPNDSMSPNHFDKRRIKAQIRSLLLPDIAARRATEYVVDYEHEAFCERYVPTMRGDTSLRIRQCIQANGLQEGPDYAIGHRSIWLSYEAWKTVEDGLRAVEKARRKAQQGTGAGDEESVVQDVGDDITTEHDGPAWSAGPNNPFTESSDNLARGGYVPPQLGYGMGGLPTPVLYRQQTGEPGWESTWEPKQQLAPPDVVKSASTSKEEVDLIINEKQNVVEEIPQSRSRRVWVALVWLTTWFIPSFLLHHVGGMKRPDVRFAWREKVTICVLIAFACGVILFYIIVFGRLLCPDFDKAWDINEVGEHTTLKNLWVAVQGNVYDISQFEGDHSDIAAEPVTTDLLLQLAGMDLTQYFPVPLVLGCAGLVTNQMLTLRLKNSTITVPQAVHTSGALQSATGTKLDDPDWYTKDYLPRIKNYLKGPLVITAGDVFNEAANGDRTWAIWNNDVYDLTDYFFSLTTFQGVPGYDFLNESITDLFKQQPGLDISKQLNAVIAQMDPNTAELNTACLRNNFFVGEVDFRKSARCQVQNYLLLAFSSLIFLTIGIKFVAALQLGSKRSPELQDKFILCQVPCYTEGEESLRRTLDSLAALRYDDKRKLIFLICDGNIIGSGNDRPTPRIVLDILGVDPKLDPEPLLFKSVGEGSKQINYGKVYSGLYEFEGHVVPYMVVVKVGKPSERSRPGNRGKRDSQILLMHYLNRVHFDAPMSPLELEIYHQMRNVIGIDPAFYEYIFTVDADTTAEPDSLNRLVAQCASDSRIVGVCGETKLDNEQGSWWTMIQVYEYYISHHLSKAFESLFGSVTCLPGCFSLYRIRTADKGRPIIISNRVIDDYAEPNVDTLHKKNLLSLGEDRYLTTLLLKHFPTYKTKFSPHAIAHTIAPDKWTILLSQRRRWINSTVHNLCELVFLPELCGFCCFSMRFIVFIDLLGTIILPATAVYLLYLIVTVALGQAPIPIISLALIATVYGLQAIIFLLKREFMLIGWMVIYLLAYPIYSFLLPIYSFWRMDDFSWGNTRLVIGEGSNRKVIIADDEKFDESMIPLKKFSEYEAETWDAASGHTGFSQPGAKPARSPGQVTPRSQSPHQAGDFYRDTNLTMGGTSSNPNLRNMNRSQTSLSQFGGVAQPVMPPSRVGTPQLAPMPFMSMGGGMGSIAGGSEYGGMPQMAFTGTPSIYGVPMTPGPMNVMSMYQPGLSSNSVLNQPMGRMSTFSVPAANPFANPNQNTNPTNEEILDVLRHYLATQDLMSVTKKTAREAVMAQFPRADLTSRKDFLNHSIDEILSEA